MRGAIANLKAWIGWSGLVFLSLLVLYIVTRSFSIGGGWQTLLFLCLLIFGAWTTIVLIRQILRRAIWRLRNRLLMTYMFIAVVPITLILCLVYLGVNLLSNQIAIYLVTSALDRRVETIAGAAKTVAAAPPEKRVSLVADAASLLEQSGDAGLEILLRDNGREWRFPQDAPSVAPPGDWPDTSGLVLRDQQPFLWAHARTGQGDITMTVPMTADFLASLVPNFGVIDFGDAPAAGGQGAPVHARAFVGGATVRQTLPPAMNRFDREVRWVSTVWPSDWNHPSEPPQPLLIQVRTRLSTLLGALFNRQEDLAQNAIIIMLVAGLVIFLVVEIASVVAGVGLTRTITNAVHHLYEGTQRVIAGDFSHRIEAQGNNQLADLSRSFNRMTENVQQLLLVAKEKERLQSEIEIAREVQSQLYPRELPKCERLRLTAACHPARMVSGDYYDYALVRDAQVAIAIGDVAGKGISAALLMAALQSSLRIQIQNLMEAAAVAAGDPLPGANLSTSQLVSRLNRQLYAATSPEKYATFCLGLYDDSTGVLTYTNAGHLPPMLFRNGQPERLDVNGTVVGAFSFAKYAESSVEMRPGDLLVWFTDGVTEPENSYGEMFGEQRLMELLARNAHRTEAEIVASVVEAVRQWTGSDELQDDMTLLLARRL